MDKKHPLERRWVRLCIYVLLIYVAALIALYARQRDLVFQPSGVAPLASEVMEGASDMTLPTADGEVLQAYWKAPKNGGYTALYLHGNAGNLGRRAALIQGVSDAVDGVLALSWRGYGNSTGTPTEQGLYDDGRAAIGWLLRQGVALDHLIVVGESLGTGVAVQMPTEFDIAGMLLIAPYTKLTDIGARQYPFVPVELLMKDKFASIDKLDLVNAPLVVVHSEDDTLVPTAMGKALYEAAKAPKELLLFADRSHVDFLREEIARAAGALVHLVKAAKPDEAQEDAAIFQPPHPYSLLPNRPIHLQ